MTCIARNILREGALPSSCSIRCRKYAVILARLLLFNGANGLPLLLHLMTLPNIWKVLVARDYRRRVQQIHLIIVSHA